MDKVKDFESYLNGEVIDLGEMSNIDFVKMQCAKEHTIVCTDRRTGVDSVVSPYNEKNYNAENQAVKLYICLDENNDGHMDHGIGEKEFNEHFYNFRYND